MIKNSVRHALYLRNHVSYDCHLQSVSLRISGTVHHMIHRCKMMISAANFFTFQNFDFQGFQGVKGQKMICNYLYLRNCRLDNQDFDNDIYRCFSLLFLKKCNIVNINFFIGPLQQFFNNYLFFKFFFFFLIWIHSMQG